MNSRIVPAAWTSRATGCVSIEALPTSVRDLGPERKSATLPELESARVSPPVALVAPTVRMARSLATSARENLPGTALVPFTLAAYRRAEDPPRRVVLCPPGKSVANDVAFLRAAAARLLWPAPPARVAEAIGGIRTGDEPPPPASAARRSPRGPRAGAALLLEGRVDAARALAALRGSRTREWIVESVGSVRLSPRALARLAREGVRWSVLAPVAVEAVCASRELAKVRRAWRALLPPRTPVWVPGKKNR